MVDIKQFKFLINNGDNFNNIIKSFKLAFMIIK